MAGLFFPESVSLSAEVVDFGQHPTEEDLG
jgi:hypothetical protein